jgi:hypothetical protein
LEIKEMLKENEKVISQRQDIQVRKKKKRRSRD